MSTSIIREEARDVPVIDEVDVCVIGGSCTGVFAAVSAARLGARVALVENNGFFGGVATAGLVSIWHSLLDAKGKQQIIAGLTEEVIKRLQARNAVEVREPTCTVLNTEELKLELDELVTEAGVRPYLHCRFVQPVMDGARVEAAVVEDKSGRRAIRSAYFIDASGDGDLIARAGLPFRTCENIQPPTTCVVLHGLAEIRKHHADFSIGEALFDPQHTAALKDGFVWMAKVPGVSGATLVVGTRVPDADCSDADKLTIAEIEGRKQVRTICDILRENFRGGDTVSIGSMSACIGIRETRHACCLHTITEDELLSGGALPDAIANGSYPVDIHYSDRPGITLRYLDGTEKYLVPGRVSEDRRWRDEDENVPTFYQIPYRALVPKGADNVLVAGRLVDADRGAYGALRVMVNCNQTGEAAGTASYLAGQAGCSVAEVDCTKLRKTMAKQGALIL